VKWGIVFSSTGFPDPDSAIAVAQAAEQAAFESLWAPEHIIMSMRPDATAYQGSLDGRMDRLARRGGIPDPLIWFAYVASSTTRIRFGTGVVILPEHQPVVLAKTAATLDHLCGGRLMLGIGVGEIPEEYAAAGMNFGDRGRRMDEYIEAMRVLWRDDEATYSGGYVAFDRVQCRPWPVRRAIPLHIGGSSPAAIRRAGACADGYFPYVPPTADPLIELPRVIAEVRSATIAAGRDPEAMEITAGSARTIDDAKRYADFGIHRMTVAIRARDIAQMRDEVARLGDELVGPTTDL
jgi:probable F420-dependent oxidoreductase